MDLRNGSPSHRAMVLGRGDMWDPSRVAIPLPSRRKHACSRVRHGDRGGHGEHGVALIGDAELNELTRRIIGGAIEVHRHLGPGLLESTYETFLALELRIDGLRVERQVPVPVEYRGRRVECGYRIDMLVEKSVVVELKVVDAFHKVHVSQVLTYLRLAELRVGLLLNFNVDALSDGGIRRVLRG